MSFFKPHIGQFPVTSSIPLNMELQPAGWKFWLQHNVVDSSCPSPAPIRMEGVRMKCSVNFLLT